METLGHLLHSVGETVGLVARDEKKEEPHAAAGAAPSGSAGAAPAANSAAYAEWERQHKEGGILSSIADAARTALVPPPLSADPSLEVIEPVKPPGMSLPEERKAEEATPKAEEEEEKPSTFLGNLLHKVEKKIEEALPMVAPHAADKKEEAAPHDEDVRVSALGPVWDKEEAEAGETSTGKLEAAEEKHGPAADTRDASMEPLAPVGAKSQAFEPARQSIPMQAEVRASPAPVTFTPARKGDVMFVQATPKLSAESQLQLRAHPVRTVETPSERRAEIGDWETEGGKVRQETENKGYLSDATAEAKKEAIGVSDEELHMVQEAADRVMAQNAQDRRTSISPLEEKKDEFPERELKVEFAPAPAHGGFALEPPSETVAAGVKLEREEAAKAEEFTPLLGARLNLERVRTEFADIVPEGARLSKEAEEQPAKKEEVRSHEGYDRIKDKEEEMPRGAEEKAEAETEGEAPAKASKQVSVNTLIKLVVEPIARIDESKLPSLTPEVAFAAPAAPHEPTHHEYHPKHTHNDRLPGRAEHYVNQPRHQS